MMGIVLQWRRWKRVGQTNHLDMDIPLYINIGVGFLLVNIGNLVACVCAWCERSAIMLYWYKTAGLIGGYNPHRQHKT